VYGREVIEFMPAALRDRDYVVCLVGAESAAEVALSAVSLEDRGLAFLPVAGP
jgi:hypothetical protein